MLAVTSIMLLTTIESRLDSIWRVHAPRGWVARVMIYWTVLTLGPLLFGLAMSISTSLHLTTLELGAAGVAALPLLERLAWTLPVPAAEPGADAVLLPHPALPGCAGAKGCWGGVTAGILLEICKFGFTLFIDHYNSYEAIYGALAVIPIFLLWMYLSWSVVLFGAEIAAAVPLWDIDEALVAAPQITDLELALRLLEALSTQNRRGGTARLRQLARKARAPTGAVGGLPGPIVEIPASSRRRWTAASSWPATSTACRCRRWMRRSPKIPSIPDCRAGAGGSRLTSASPRPDWRSRSTVGAGRQLPRRSAAIRAARAW
ncbi:MAG: YhjD/YihY/BrkB family envelope integrity protein [Aliidongia sp.]